MFCMSSTARSVGSFITGGGRDVLLRNSRVNKHLASMRFRSCPLPAIGSGTATTFDSIVERSLGWIGLVPCANHTMSCSFAKSRVCHGGMRYLLLSFYGHYGRSQEAFQAYRKRSCRDAHCAPLRAALGVGAPTSDVARHRVYAPVFLSCVVKAHPPALVLWPRCRGRPARQSGLPQFAFRTPCSV